MDEAHRYYAQAAELAVDASDRAELLERAGDAAAVAGHAGVAAGLLEEAVAILTSEGRSHPAARVSARLGEVTWDLGDAATALERMEAAFSHLVGEEADADLGMLAAALARFHTLSGSDELATERVDAALRIADGIGLPQVSAEALITKGILLSHAGRRAEAHALTGHALDIALEHNLTASGLRASFNLASVFALGDDFAAAVAELTRALGRARTVGNRLWEWRLLGQMVGILVKASRWDEAMGRAAELPDLDVSAGIPGLQGNLVTLVRTHVHRGELEEGRRLLRATAAVQSSADAQDIGAYAAAAAAMAGATGAHEEAVTQGALAFDTVDTIGSAEDWITWGFTEAVAAALVIGDEATVERLIARSTDRSLLAARFHQAHVERARGGLAARRGDRAAAAAAYAASAKSFRGLDTPFDLAVSLLLLAGVTDGSEAPAMLAEARAVFTRLRAAPWLDRAGEVAAALQASTQPAAR
jgi:tetratricopeptide (TPR) repeat protein